MPEEKELGADHLQYLLPFSFLEMCSQGRKNGGGRAVASMSAHYAGGGGDGRRSIARPRHSPCTFSQGSSAYNSGKIEEAEGYYGRALIVQEVGLADDHPRVAEIRRAPAAKRITFVCSGFNR